MSRDASPPAKNQIEDQQRRYHDEQSFLADRAVAEATPLPEDETEVDAQAQQALRIIPGNRAEAGTHTFLASSGGIDRPRTPPHLSIEDSRALLTRLTGLQPWQLEAFPDELPPLPVSGPSSPTRSPEHARPTSSFSERRLSSSTAIPIRFRKPPVSPAVQQREFIPVPEAEPASSPVTQKSPVRGRHAKSPSKEFTTSREFRPLYLVERNRKSDELQDEDLPELPSSGSPSRASSARESETETEGEYESAHESAFGSPHESPGEMSDAFFDPLSVVTDLISPAPGPEVVHPVLDHREFEDVTESGQATPRASDFISPAVARDVQTSAGPSHDALTAALEQAKAAENDVPATASPGQASPGLAASPFFDDKLMRDDPATRSEDFSPAKSSSLLQEAALGALAGGVAGAALQSASSKKKGKKGKKGKGKQTDTDAERIEPALESPLSTPALETPERSEQAYVPTFVDNEDDWAKNKPESLIADDDTLVGEPSASAALETSKLEAERKQDEVLGITRPQTQDQRDVQVRRSIIEDVSHDMQLPERSPTPKDIGEEKAIDAAASPDIFEDGSASVAVPAAEQTVTISPEPEFVEVEAPQEATEDAVQAPARAPSPSPDPALSSSPARSSWGSGLWGAIGGWGRKKQPPTPTSAAETVQAPAPAVFERDTVQAAPVADPIVEEQQANQAHEEASISAPEITGPSPALAESDTRFEQLLSQYAGEISTAAPIVLNEAKAEDVASDAPAAKSAALTLDTEISNKDTEDGGYKSLPRTYTPQTAIFTDNGRPYGFGTPQVTASTTADAVPAAVSEQTPREAAIDVDQPVDETAAAAAVEATTPAAEEDLPKTASSKKKKGKKGKKNVSQSTEPILTEELSTPQDPEPAVVAQETTTPYTLPRTSYFGDGGVPAFAFPSRIVVPAEEAGPSAAVAENIDNSVPLQGAVSASESAPEQSVVTEHEPYQYSVPQTSYFGDGGLPSFSFPGYVPAVSSEQEQSLPESSAIEDADRIQSLDSPAPQALTSEATDVPREAVEEHVARPITEVEIVPSVREIVTDVPGVDPIIDVHDAVEPAPVVEETPAPSKKKGKKNKKKRESNVPDTPVVTRPSSPTKLEEEPLREVIDTSLDDAVAVPLPDDGDDLADPALTAPAEETVHTSTEAATEAATSVLPDETEVPVVASEVVSDQTPKKKSKKNKRKSGVQTPEVQTEPVAEPAERSLPETETETTAAAPIDDSQSTSRDEFVDATDVPAQDASVADGTLRPAAEVLDPAPVEADIETEAWLEGKPLDHASTLLEKENPLETEVTVPAPDVIATEAPATEGQGENIEAIGQPAGPLSKKEKKKRKKKGSGVETPVEEVPAPVVLTEAEPATDAPSHGNDQLDVVQEPAVSRAVDVGPVTVEEQTNAVEPTADVPLEATVPHEQASINEPTPSSDITEPQHIQLGTPSTTVVAAEAEPRESDIPSEPIPTEKEETSELPIATSKKDKKKKKGKKGKSVDEPSTPVSEIEPILPAPEAAPTAEVVAEPTTLEAQSAGDAPIEASESREMEVSEQAPVDPADVPLPAESTEPDVLIDEAPAVPGTSQDVQDSEAVRIEHAEEAIQAVAEDDVAAPADAPLDSPSSVPVQDEPVIESKKNKKKKGKKGKAVETEPSTPVTEELPLVDAIASDVKPVQEQGETPKPELVPEATSEAVSNVEDASPKDLSLNDVIARDILEPSFDYGAPSVISTHHHHISQEDIGTAPTIEQAQPEDLPRDEVPRDISEPTPTVEDATSTNQEPQVDETPAADPFAGLNKTQRKKLEKKMKAEAAAREAEAAASLVAEAEKGTTEVVPEGSRTELEAESAEQPIVQENAVSEPAVIEGEATGQHPPVEETPAREEVTIVHDTQAAEETPAPDESLAVRDITLEGKLNEGTPAEEALVVEAPVVEAAPEEKLTEEKPIEDALVEEKPAVDPFKGLTKTQKKKLQAKMKAEAEAKQKEAEAEVEVEAAQKEAEGEAVLALPTTTEEPSQEPAAADEAVSQTPPAIEEAQTSNTLAVEEDPSVQVPTSANETTTPVVQEADVQQTVQSDVDLADTVPLTAEDEHPNEEMPVSDATPVVDPFAGLNKKQRKKLQQKMDAEAAQKAAEQAVPSDEPIQVVAATEGGSSAVDPNPEVVVAKEVVPEDGTRTGDDVSTEQTAPSETSRALTPEAPPTVAETAPEVTVAAPDAVDVPEQAAEELAPAIEEVVVDPFAGLNKKDRKKLEKKMKAEAEALAQAQAEVEVAGKEDVAVKPAQDTANDIETTASAPDAADVPSEIPTIVEPTVDTLSQDQPGEAIIAEHKDETPVAETTIAEEPLPETSTAYDTVADLSVPDTILPAEAVPVEAPLAETSNVEAEPVDPFKGLNKKQRQKLEKKLKAEAEAKETADSLAAAEEIAAPAETEEAIPVEPVQLDATDDSARTVDVVPAPESVSEVVQTAETQVDGPEVPVAVQADAGVEETIQADAPVVVTEEAPAEPSEQDVSKSEPEPESLTTEIQTAELAEVPIVEAPTAEAPAVDPFKGLNKKQRQKLEKKMKAEAEAREKEEAEAGEKEEARVAADQDAATAIETPLEVVTGSDSATPAGEIVESETPRDVAEVTAADENVEEMLAPVEEPTPSVAEPSVAGGSPADAIPATEASVAETEPVDPFKGLNKKQRQKLEKKMAAEAAQREAELALAKTETRSAEADVVPSVDGVVSEEGPATDMQRQGALDTPVIEEKFEDAEEAVRGERSVEVASTPDAEVAPKPSQTTDADPTPGPAAEITTEPEQQSTVDEPAPEVPVDPFAGLNKTQRKKLEKKLKAEAEKKEQEELARAQEVVESGEATTQAAGEETKTEVVDETWPAEDMLVEDVATEPTLETNIAATEPSTSLDVVADKAHDGLAREISEPADTITEPAVIEESTANRTSTEPEPPVDIEIAESEEPTTSKKSKKKKKGKKGESNSEPQTPVAEISEPVLSSEPVEGGAKAVEEETIDVVPAPASGDLVEAAPQIEDAGLESTAAEPIVDPAANATEVTVEQPIVDAPTAEQTAIVEESTSSKKGKKKAKKDKRTSIAESEPAMPLETSAEEVPPASTEVAPDSTQVPGDASELPNEPTSVSTIVPDAAAATVPEPTTDVGTEDVQDIAQETVDTAPILSKKDKKKAKKSKRVSIAEDSLPVTPVAEEEKQLGDAVEERAVDPEVSDVAGAELEKPIETESAIWGEVKESEIVPAEAAEAEAAVTGDIIPTEPATTESVLPEPASTAQEEPVVLSKKDKKKAKKAKRGSVAEVSEPATPTETPAAELDRFSFEAPSTSEAQTAQQEAEVIAKIAQETAVAPTSEETSRADELPEAGSDEQHDRAASITEKALDDVTVEEESSSVSKKDKKKAKKAKRASTVTEAESFEPTTGTDVLPQEVQEQITEQPQTEINEPSTLASDAVEAKLEDDHQPVISSETPAEAVPDDRPPPAPVEDPEPLSSLDAHEPAIDESAPLSKAQKKKAKKAKRGSLVENEISQPATPIEEAAKELVPEELAPEPTPAEDQATEVLPDEEADLWFGGAPSRKGKKKNKKSQETATDSFLADEATRAANVSEPQPSPSNTTTSETPITFSGIPTQYPPTNTDGSVELATDSARGVSEQGENVEGKSLVQKEGAEGGDDTLLDAVTEQRDDQDGKERERKVVDAATAEPDIVQSGIADAADTEAQRALDSEPLVPVEHSTVEPAGSVLEDTTVAVEKGTVLEEPATIVEAETAPANEGDAETTTTSKKKKKAKKNKRASTTEELVKEAPETSLVQEASAEMPAEPAPQTDVEAQSAFIAPAEQVNVPDEAAQTESEAVVDQSNLVDIVPAHDEIEQQTTTTDSIVDDVQQPSVQLDEPQEAAPSAPEPMAETDPRDDQPPIAPSETIVDPPVLSKKDKKKAKKTKKQSGSATPLEEPIAAVEPPIVRAVGETEVEESATPREMEMEQESAELASKLEPQYDNVASLLEPGAKPAEAEEAKITPDVVDSLDRGVEPEHVPAELATQLEPQQDAAQPIIDRAIDATSTSEIQPSLDADAGMVVTEDSLPTIERQLDNSDVVEPEPALGLSKKDKKKNKKSKRQSGTATPADNAAVAVVADEEKETAVPEAVEGVAGPVVEPAIEAITELQEVETVVAPSNEKDVSAPPANVNEAVIEEPMVQEPVVADSKVNITSADADTVKEPVTLVEDPVVQEPTLSEREVEAAPVTLAEEEIAGPPLSKKDKKKAKKSKKASGTTTPLVDETAVQESKVQSEPLVESNVPETSIAEVSGGDERGVEVVAGEDSGQRAVVAPEEPIAAPEEPSMASEEPTVTPEESVEPEEPTVASEEPVIAENDTAASSSKKSKKKKKKGSIATPLVEETVSKVIEELPSGSVLDAPVESNVVAEPEPVVPSELPVSDDTVATVEPTHPAATDIADPISTKDNETIIEKHDIQSETIVQEPTVDSNESPLVKEFVPEPVELQRPMLDRKLSKKEKKALKKGTVTPLQDEVVEDAVDMKSTEKEVVDLAGEDFTTIRDPQVQTTDEMGKAEAIVEPVLEPLAEPAVEPVVKPVVEPVVEPATHTDNKPTDEPEILQDAKDEHIAQPAHPEPVEVAADDEWAPLPKKSKKGKKAKKQPVVSEPIESISQSAETVEPASLPDIVMEDAPLISTAAEDLVLPEPTPLEVETPVAMESAVDRDHPLASDLPLPEPTPMETSFDPLPEIRNDALPSGEDQPILEEQRIVPEQEVQAEREEAMETPALLNPMPSEESKEGENLRDVVERTEAPAQTEEKVTSNAVGETIAANRSPVAETKPVVPNEEVTSESGEAVPVLKDVKHEVEIDRDEPMPVDPGAVPQPIESFTLPQPELVQPAHDVLSRPEPLASVEDALEPAKIAEETLTRSSSKKDKKKKKKSKKDIERIEQVEEQTKETQAPVAVPQEEQIAGIEPSYVAPLPEIEHQRPNTPVRDYAQPETHTLELSPSLQAVREEAAELRQRSEALDKEMAVTEEQGEPSKSQATSIFDVANLLNNKDRNEADTTRNIGLPDPATPAAEPEAAVETMAQVESAVETPSAPLEVPSRKLSKKEKKKKGKQTAIVAGEHVEPAHEDVSMMDASVADVVDQSVAETTTTTATAPVEVPAREVEVKGEVMLDPVLAPSAATTTEALADQNDDVPVSRDVGLDDPPALPRKLSKKDKKKQAKLAAAEQDESTRDNKEEKQVEREQSLMQDETAKVEEEKKQRPIAEPTTSREAGIEDTNVIAPVMAGAVVASALARGDSKKGKKKDRKSRASTDVATEVEVSTDEDTHRQGEQFHTQPPTAAVEELERTSISEPVHDDGRPNDAAEPTLESTLTVDENLNAQSTQPSSPAKTLDNISEDVLPTLNKKSSKKHRLAALFETQSPEEQLREANKRSLGHKRSGSVKNLAEQFENQTKSTTPLHIVPPKSISRAASDDHLRSVSPYDNLERLRSASPRHDVDFAAAVAAGLNESGFDPSYVINNASFYRSRSTSRQGDRDMGPDDEVETARRRASVSKFSSFGRASASTSPTKVGFASPTKLGSASPTKTGFASAPATRTTFESERILPKGIEVPLAANMAPSFDPMDVLNDPSFVGRKSPPGVLEEADPEELYAPSKSRKLLGKQKRGSDAALAALSLQNSVEQKANETQVLENALARSRTGKDLAGSTTSELGGHAHGDRRAETSNVERRSSNKIHSVRGEEEDEPRGRSTERDSRKIKTPISALPETAADKDVSEYPFPRVSTPEAGEPVVRSRKEEKRASGSQKGKEVRQEVRSPEQHKRRTHPVAFKEEQPEEKRLHRSEVQTGTGLEPSWSFQALGDDTNRVEEPALKTRLSRDLKASREDRPHPQGPRTPRQKSSRELRGSQEIEASPALPVFSPSKAAEPSPLSDFNTKERSSVLFDSSPSTRAYGTSPKVAPKTPNNDSRRDSESSSKTPIDRPRPEQTSPVGSTPHQSIFGGPIERNNTTTTPLPKHARTPTTSLGTITENSPDDALLVKKGRSVSGAGSGERSLRSNRSFSDRIKSPPPTTPTPVTRRNTSAQDSPWHQANDPVDRSVALSPARRLPHSTPDPIKHQLAEIRDSPGLRSQQSLSNISKIRSPDAERPASSMSMASNASNHSLRRMERAQSGDLRAAASAARLGEASAPGASNATEPNLAGIASIALAAGAVAAASKLRGEGKGRRASMAETFVSSREVCGSRIIITNNTQEAMGEAPRSPMSPTRPPSLRKRQSIQIMDLQTQLDQLADHNKALEDARLRAEETLHSQQHQRQIDEQLVQEAVEARDRQVHQRDIDIAQLKDTLQRLQEEIARLTDLNNNLTEANRHLTNDANERYAHLQSEGQLVHQQWQTSQKELETLRSQHQQMTRGMEGALREEIGAALDERNAEISRLERELSNAKEQIKTLQKQILASKKPSESFLTIRDEDYFDSACQQLCQHVQQWVLRFSKFSDTRPCRLSSDIQADARLDTATREKIDKRLDNAILDGSDVDALLADRVRRRDVFMSIVMSMIWEYVFTRYLFGMDREQRQKLKALEKTLSEVGTSTTYPPTIPITNIYPGPPRAVAQWRAITLTLLSKREPFMHQRAQDTEAVVHEIYSTLSTLLSPPTHLQHQIQASLRNVMRLAVELSIEMRTQRAEYIMLPPLQPEYDVHGDLVAKVSFNASLMNERSGETSSNDELEAKGAIVKVVLFPLVVKKGDDFGEGEDEIVVCPAQVLVARQGKKKVVRVLSGAMSSYSRASSKGRSQVSLAPESSVMDVDGPEMV